MKLFEIQRRPDARQLRQFGVACAFALPLAGLAWGAPWSAVGILALGGSLVALAGFARPASLRLLYVGLSYLTAPIGRVVSELTLLFVYFGVLTPLAIAFRVVGRDALALRTGRGSASGWIPRRPPGGPASYFRQS